MNSHFHLVHNLDSVPGMINNMFFDVVKSCIIQLPTTGDTVPRTYKSSYGSYTDPPYKMMTITYTSRLRGFFLRPLEGPFGQNNKKSIAFFYAYDSTLPRGTQHTLEVNNCHIHYCDVISMFNERHRQGSQNIVKIFRESLGVVQDIILDRDYKIEEIDDPSLAHDLIAAQRRYWKLSRQLPMFELHGSENATHYYLHVHDESEIGILKFTVVDDHLLLVFSPPTQEHLEMIAPLAYTTTFYKLSKAFSTVKIFIGDQPIPTFLPEDFPNSQLAVIVENEIHNKQSWLSLCKDPITFYVVCRYLRNSDRP